MKWANIKTEGLPQLSHMLCVFAEWYEPWQCFTHMECMEWLDIQAHRKHDLQHHYTHWIEVPGIPPEVEANLMPKKV